MIARTRLPLRAHFVAGAAMLFVIAPIFFARPTTAKSWINDMLHIDSHSSGGGERAHLDHDPSDYGVDISTQIHGRLKKDTFQGKRYFDMIQGCYDAYSRAECDSTETARVRMNLEQPGQQHNYTEVGFKKIRTPSLLWESLLRFYNMNREKEVTEEWPRGNTYVNHWSSSSSLISLDDGKLRGSGYALKKQIWDGVRPVIEEWTGKKLKETSMYGVRVYKEGAILATHLDRLPLVSSCIINVDQDLDEPWPLEVYDHNGKAHNITMIPGDMVLYESHTVLHGRPFPLKGRYFANLFVHFIPVDHAELNALDKLPRPTTAVSQLTKKLGGHESDNHAADDVNKTFRQEQLDKVRSLQTKRLAEPIDFKNTDLNPEFLAAIRDDKYDELSDADPPSNHDTKSSGKFTLYQTDLHIAAAHGNLKRVKELLSSPNSDVDARDENGWQPLHEAVHGGHLEVTKLLLAHGANISSKTNGGGTPMWWARGTFAPDHPMITFLEGLNAPSEGVEDDEKEEEEEEEWEEEEWEKESSE